MDADATGSTAYFVGPSLPASDVRAIDPHAVIRPPGAHGDVARAARDGARTIVVIDGVFEAVRSLWHKEILWAIDRGCRLIGAASMGALRAAECAAFGMEPVGRIAADYVSGRRTSDGDVALLHAGADDDWMPLSEALANVDATVANLRWHGAVSGEEADKLHHCARRIFYADRTWARVVDLATERRSIPVDRAERVLHDGRRLRVDQKAIDARLAVDRATAQGVPRRPAFEFAATSYWRRGFAAIAGEPSL